MSGFFIRKPQYILPTFRATEKTLEICNLKFGDEHNLDNKANAFRHALWNFLLCQGYYKKSGSVDKSVLLSKKITDLHEDLFPNLAMARKMDLHNNKTGRRLFYEDQTMDIIPILELMLDNALKITSNKDREGADGRLVYLED